MVPGFADAGTVAGEFLPMSASRALDADSTEIMNRARITVRGQTIPDGFDRATWRLAAKGKDRVILSVHEQDIDNRFVTFVVGLAE